MLFGYGCGEEKVLTPMAKIFKNKAAKKAELNQ